MKRALPTSDTDDDRALRLRVEDECLRRIHFAHVPEAFAKFASWRTLTLDGGTRVRVVVQARAGAALVESSFKRLGGAAARVAGYEYELNVGHTSVLVADDECALVVDALKLAKDEWRRSNYAGSAPPAASRHDSTPNAFTDDDDDESAPPKRSKRAHSPLHLVL